MKIPYNLDPASLLASGPIPIMTSVGELVVGNVLILNVECTKFGAIKHIYPNHNYYEIRYDTDANDADVGFWHPLQPILIVGSSNVKPVYQGAKIL